MTSRVRLLILALQLSRVIANDCDEGFQSSQENGCVDFNECQGIHSDYEDQHEPICGENANCINTNGSFHCVCVAGFRTQSGNVRFSAASPELCQDINECLENENRCGENAHCYNAVGSHSCICNEGYVSSNGKESFHSFTGVTCEDRNECLHYNCGQNSVCHNTPGSHLCVCNPGFRQRSDNSGSCEEVCPSDGPVCGNGRCQPEANGHSCVCYSHSTNYGNKQSRCTELDCDIFDNRSLQKTLPGLQEIMNMVKASCLGMSDAKTPAAMDAEALLYRLLSAIDKLLSGGPLNDNNKVSALLNIAENTMKLISPLMKNTETKMSNNHTDVEIFVHWDDVSPFGALTLRLEHVHLDSHWETAAGDNSTYPGFATILLLSYKGLEKSTNDYFSGVKIREGQRFQINSQVVTAAVSNKRTNRLEEPVTFTFNHLTESDEGDHTCVYWDSSVGGGRWSDRGCTVVESNAHNTVCSCSHLSSFAVLLALYEFEEPFALKFITWVGLSLSQLCLLLSIFTFSLCRSIQSTRTTIHLHLCVSLFVANLVFLAGISRTGNQAGCAVVAGLLHFFFLASFCWMCLEGVQLFRMVVLVFNTTARPLYLMAVGYGVPALIVTISAVFNARGYGTKRHCWLSLEHGFIWSFFGPICTIIFVNICFFIITVWKLAQKFSSLNPDLNSLRKIKAFTVTAVAQLCLLGTMWIFGCFQFEKGTLAMSYLFTIFNSLQGLLIFIMHCLFPKQVREEYGKLLSNLCIPKKEKYSEFSSNQSTSKSQTSKSGPNTGESQI